MKVIFRYIINTLFALIVALLLLLGALVLGLQFPAVQTALVEKATTWLSQKLQHPTSVGRVNIKWFDAISLQDVKILDLKGRPMIQVERLDLNHDFLALALGKDKKTFGTSLDDAMLYRPTVWLIKDPKTGDLNLDEFIARIEQLTTDPTKPPGPKDQNVPFFIKQVHLVEGTFRWDDPREAKMQGRAFDYNHFELRDINGEARNLMILGDTIALKIKGLKATDKRTDLTIKSLDTRLLYCRTKLELADLYGRIGNSTIGTYLSFNYDTPAAFGHFNSQVRMVAHLDNAVVQSEDLGWFASYLFTLRETWRATGDLDGTVDDFSVANTHLTFGKNSRIKGNIAFKDVTNFNKSVMDFALRDTRVDAADLYQYYPQKSFTDLANKFGVVDMNGQYKGTVERFQLKGDFKTALGAILVRDLQMDLSKPVPTYITDVQTTAFNLGKFIDDESFGEVAYDGKITGQGFSIKNASLNSEGRMAKFRYNHYDYRDIYWKGNLQKKLFNGLIVVKDPNFGADIDGFFDFSKPKNLFQAQGVIHHADLRALNFTKDSLVIHTDLDVDFEGNNIDEMVGRAKFLNSYATLNTHRNLVMDSLLIDSRLADSTRRLSIESEFFNFLAAGRFQPTKAINDLATLFDEYQMYFLGDEATQSNYYAQKSLKNAFVQRYSVDYKLRFKKMERLLAFLYPSGFVSNGSTAEGGFTIDKTSIFSLTGQFDTLRLGNNTFYKSQLDLNTSKFTNNPEVLASAIVESEKQQLVGIAPTEKLNIEAAWDKDHINFRSNLRQRKSSNRAALNGELRFVGDHLYLQFKRSRLKLLDEDWNVDANNLTTIIGPNVTFSNLAIKSKEQLISLNGDISTDSLRALAFEMRNFQLATLNPVLNTNLTGIANGSVRLRDLYRTTIFDTKWDVQKLTYNNFLMGNLIGDGEWDPQDKHLHIDTHLDRNDRRNISINGTYTPNAVGNELDLVANFDETDLSLIGPFARGLVSDLSGRANGKVGIKGSYAAPSLDGVVDVKRGRLTFDYLKAAFAFEDKVYFGESDIRVKRMQLTDPEGNVATLRGGVFHDSFRKFSLGFEADMRNFRILNTTIRDNELFYGTAYATGKMEILGPINNLKINTDLTSNRGTKIYIPLDGAAEVASEDFVQFLAPANDTTKASATTEDKIIPAEESIIKMDLRLNITPDAYCEIQFNRQTGEAIKAYGRGLINLKIDTQDEFTMAGSYEIQNGSYPFSLSNGLLPKNFVIQNGSRISWTGDPYEAILDVKASYTQNALLSPLVRTGTNITGNEWSRRYPVEVILGLTDRMLQPIPTWNVKFKEYPASGQLQISAAEARLKSDEQYLARQVSSMLLFGQLLSEENDILAQSAQGITNNISEMVSSNLNKWASSISENLELGVSGLNVNFGDPNAFNNLQLRFSYRFLNDRFRITRDGRLSYGQNQYDATSLLLDWTLEYWLTNDGSQRLRMYNRNIQNQFTSSAGSPNAVSYGASYLFTRSFNNFRILGPKQSRSDEPLPTDTGRLTTMKAGL